MDESVWASEPYTQQDLQNQVDWRCTASPYCLDDLLATSTNYVAGINAYIAKAQDATRC